MTQFVGIDISKDTFDFYFEQAGRAMQWQLQQSEADYEVFVKLIGLDRCCVMRGDRELSHEVRKLFTSPRC